MRGPTCVRIAGTDKGRQTETAGTIEERIEEKDEACHADFGAPA